MQRIFSGTIATLLLLAAGRLAAGPVGEIILYDFNNFNGESLRLFKSTPNLGNFNNDASSVRIISGTWTLYRNANYGVTPSRPSITLPPGNYPNLADEGFPRNRLSSVRFIIKALCAPGTRPGPGGQCVCKPGLVETGTDDAGRLVCGPGQVVIPPPASPGQVLAPPPKKPGTRPDRRQSVTLPSCPGPYRIALPQNGQMVCRWTCGQGTVPDETRGECVCKPGLVEAGADQRGRRTCEAPQPTGDQFYSVGGEEAISTAYLNGFTFLAEPKRNLLVPVAGWCEWQGGNFIAHFGPKVLSIYGVIELHCRVTLFGGRELADGWSFGRFEWDARSDVSPYTFRRNRDGPGYNLRFSRAKLGRSATMRLEFLLLRGPAGRDWHDAFE